jgi:hypothetical protein
MKKIGKHLLTKKISEAKAREIIELTDVSTRAVDVRKLTREINDVLGAYASHLTIDWRARRQTDKELDSLYSCTKKLEGLICQGKSSAFLQAILVDASLGSARKTGALGAMGGSW